MTTLQCVEAFSLSQPEEEQTHERHGPQSRQYLHSWGGAVIDGIRVSLIIPCGLRDITHKVGPNENVRDLSGGDCDAPSLIDYVKCVGV